MPTGNLRVLRELWHQNPPSVVLFFGIVCALIGYGYSMFPSAVIILYLAAGLLAAGVVWEVAWFGRHGGRVSLGPPGMLRRFRIALLVSISAWLILLVIALAVLLAPARGPSLLGGLVFVALFAAAPVGIAGAVVAGRKRLLGEGSGSH